MAEATATMNVRKLSDAASVVDIAGDVTAGSEDVLMDAYNEASGERTRAIVLNFSDLGYLNSGGIGLLDARLRGIAG